MQSTSSACLRTQTCTHCFRCESQGASPVSVLSGRSDLNYPFFRAQDACPPAIDLLILPCSQTAPVSVDAASSDHSPPTHAPAAYALANRGEEEARWTLKTACHMSLFLFWAY
ncbi:hypothetical protein MPTK1_7g09000 [Marchantia polymorpha subsp. ruderalis]|uniref:Uncharacterized protein n=2 Tax=Marchantia polymorpha TaxID=3197 RepID=A0AAF6BXM2_MARPO|nr:hypothetical protein MARPO_0068s0053 [Marchantia polymorpha]BBN16756.1 hypothetical protein Mp_7g09000 [Marchantia polymorpha subsp. ruderalis]|eukprot:PTQ35838.1 hypothetical protein MARPO_0068s0053 [Marchantia polymorpha]